MARKKIEEGSVEEQIKAELNDRISQIRQTFCEDNNREFSELINVNEQALSQICSGKRNAGLEIVQKILDNLPEIDANWLLRGKGDMLRNRQRIGDINNSNVSGCNVNGHDININPDAYNTLLCIVEKNQVAVKKYQEQIDRLITIIEEKK